MEFIKEEQRDTDTGIRTSNIHLSFERRKRRDRNNIGLNFGWDFSGTNKEQIHILRSPINHKQDKQKYPRYISVKPQDHKEKENILKAGK